MSKSRNYYRRMYYKGLENKRLYNEIYYSQLLDAYKTYTKEYTSSMECSSIVDVKTKPRNKFGGSMRSHWFEGDTIKAIFARFKKYRVKNKKELDAKIVKLRNKKVISKADNFKLHSAKSIVNRHPLLYDKSKKSNNYSIRAVG